MREIQSILKSFGLYKGKIDGISGPKTKKAIGCFQKLYGLPQSNRITNDTLAAMFHPKGMVNRDIPHCPERRYAGPLAGIPAQDEVEGFYGEKGKNQVKLKLPYPMVLAWDTSVTINRFSCHKKVSERLGSIFEKTLDEYGIDGIRKMRLDQFGGCLNVRRMRGGSRYSMHSWGIAVDIDPAHNQIWKKAIRSSAEIQSAGILPSLSFQEYDPFWKFVEEAGAVSLGKHTNFDWMHFQFALP